MAASTVGKEVMIAVAMVAMRYLPSTSQTPPTTIRNTNQPSGDVSEEFCLTSNSEIVIANCPPPLAQSSYHLNPALSSPQTGPALDYGLSLHPTFWLQALCVDHADSYCATDSSVGVMLRCQLAAQAIGIKLESLGKKVWVGKTLLTNILRNMIKSQKAVIKAHLSTLKSLHNEELARAKDDTEKEPAMPDRNTEACSIEPALEMCNQELVQTKDDTKQEVGHCFMMETVPAHQSSMSSRVAEEIIHTHKQKEALHIAAMQAEF
ncbi:hypothetical protein BDN71DRAFT_1435202 [Pleurotus eryngii]|uniref:Uncharacterized protein n=1 Tax=Pleurotus eryngii TaxID=5323 RepID=A0A9P5ZLR6_PLEER|nr:hypothetical protein BDN71DRAFT_1435202 [Pleurotus eryngii]